MLSDWRQTGEAVDVIIAAWNRSDTIARAIRSAVMEPKVRKVIVVDDGSTDDTADVADRIAAETSRVTVCRLPKNRGPSVARNKAIELSSSPWLSILDADDYFIPERIEKLLNAAADADFIADNILRIEDVQTGGGPPRPVFDLGVGPRRLNFEDFVMGDVNKRNASGRELGFLKPLIRRDFLDRHCLYYEEGLRLGEDYALYAQALAVGARFVVMPGCGYVSVAYATSLSRKHTRHDLERLRDFDLQLAKIVNLSNADRRALRAHYRSVDSRAQWLAVIEGFKSRDLKRILSPFARSPTVSTFLVRQLLFEGFRRFQFGLR
jgi:succinoglycan biosynthesis protein ExoU